MDALSANFEVEVVPDGELCLFSVFGRTHESFRGPKVQVIGEAVSPDWRQADFAIGFDHLERDGYLRYPLWAWSIDARELLRPLGELRGTHEREFCLFLVANPNAPVRNSMFHELHRRRHVTSPGILFNNAPTIDERSSPNWRPDKVEAVRGYRFAFGVENCSRPGYTTEKIVDAFLGGAIPLHWGDPLVDVDFDRRTFLSLHSFPFVGDFVDRVIELDDHPELLAPMLDVAPLRPHAYESTARPGRLEDFLRDAVTTVRRSPSVTRWRRRANVATARSIASTIGLDAALRKLSRLR